MPKYSGFKRRRTYGGRRRYPYRKARRLTRRVKGVERKVRKIARAVELKHFTRVFMSNPSNSPDILDFAAIARNVASFGQITDNQSRVGNKVTVTSCSVAGYFLTTRATLSSVPTEPDTMRFVILVWKGNIFPGWNDIWDNDVTTGSAMTMTQNIYAPFNTNNVTRFKILYDKIIQFTPQEIENSGWKRGIRKRFKLHLNQTYESNTVASGNGPFLACFCWSNYAISSPMYYNIVVRSRFTDM